jgi:hypothetical protein
VEKESKKIAKTLFGKIKKKEKKSTNHGTTSKHVCMYLCNSNKQTSGSK